MAQSDTTTEAIEKVQFPYIFNEKLDFAMENVVHGF